MSKDGVSPWASDVSGGNPGEDVNRADTATSHNHVTAATGSTLSGGGWEHCFRDGHRKKIKGGLECKRSWIGGGISFFSY